MSLPGDFLAPVTIRACPVPQERKLKLQQLNEEGARLDSMKERMNKRIDQFEAKVGRSS